MTTLQATEPTVNEALIALAKELRELQVKVHAIGYALADVMEQLADVGAAYVDVANAIEEEQWHTTK
jgi:hypothetical protein